ncbi:Uncharacterised protein [Legionella steigerwaltii]|uniref:Uncharacterized protein n=1 Tax=Legionella steigerwaltii TaxID=460 RepID=A0A378LB39_9GAMM|nr:hypothetical protein [Legionella steigerwaltii]KTD71917.1 hypothetical protein Lstg_2773 [Legionella steigerwaltii]STY23934.1 Uncharacterised protein [Legionella steigerwaltii]
MFKKTDGQIGEPSPVAKLKKNFLNGVSKDKATYDLVDMGVNPNRFLKNKSVSEKKLQTLPLLAEGETEEKEDEAVSKNCP